jgi:hypothetical protein
MSIQYLYIKQDPLAQEANLEPWAIRCMDGVLGRYPTEEAARTAATRLANHLTAAGVQTQLYLPGQQLVRLAALLDRRRESVWDGKQKKSG